MAANQEDPSFQRQADYHFRQARKLALRDRLSHWFSGRDGQNLLPFEVIHAALREKEPRSQGLQQVPIDKIAGSVSRYDDFTRQFLPLKEHLRERWVKVESYAMRHGWPPVELYQVGDVYFVSDGNHRVAVARQMDYDTIEAYVWCFPEAVEIDPAESLEEVLLRLEERRFMEKTGLQERHPDHEIHFTTPGRYRELLAQIERMQRALTIIDEMEIPYEEAVDAWYELLYLPSIDIICDSQLLVAFPGRTESDLFVWLHMNTDALRAQYGDYDHLAQLVERIVHDQQPKGFRRLVRWLRRILGRSSAPTPLPELEESK